MSFAQRFAEGQRIAKNLIDTYDAAKRSREIDEIVSEKPIDVITEDDAAGLHAAADSGQYDIGIKTKDDGSFDSYTVSPKSSPEMSGNVGIGGVKFQGMEYKGGLTPKQIGRMKEGKLADLEMRSDPVRGMQLKRNLAEANRIEDEREEKRAEELGIKDLLAKYSAASPQERAEILKTAPPNYVAGLSKFVAANNELRSAEAAAAAKHFMGLALKKDFAAIERDYGAYNDGLDAKIAPSPDGKIVVTRTKNGQPHDTMTFADEYDFASNIGSAYDPVGSVKAIQQQRAEIAKAKADRIARVQDAFEIETAKQTARAPFDKRRGGDGGGEAAKPGVPMAEVDRWLSSALKEKDPITGVEKQNVAAHMLVRQLVPMTAEARNGDMQGAALRAMDTYQKFLNAANGDHDAAVTALSQSIARQRNPQPVEEQRPSQPMPAPKQIQQPQVKSTGPGEVQLLEPFYALNRWRKNLQQQTNDAGN